MALNRESAGGVSREIALLVPELAERPCLGGLCCGVPAAQAIEQSLTEWAGVEEVAVDLDRGRIRVRLDATRGTTADDVLWSLRMLGFEGRVGG